LDTGLLQRRNSAHRVQQYRLKMTEIAGDLTEAKIVRNPIGSPGACVGLECTDQQFSGVVFEIAAVIVIAQYGISEVRPGHVLE